MTRRGGDRETHDRLLKAAERLFSERGFKDVTVREICRAARANVAAVNYHFGDKVGLYREIMQRAIRAMRQTTESVRRAGEGQPAEERLRRYVAIFLHALVTPGHETLHGLIEREVRSPTPALDDLVDQGLRPRVDYLYGVVAELLGCDRSDPRVLRCAGSIHSQFLTYVRPNAIATRLGFHFEPTEQQIAEAARHIAEFSLRGIEGARAL